MGVIQKKTHKPKGLTALGVRENGERNTKSGPRDRTQKAKALTDLRNFRKFRKLCDPEE